MVVENVPSPMTSIAAVELSESRIDAHPRFTVVLFWMLKVASSEIFCTGCDISTCPPFEKKSDACGTETKSESKKLNKIAILQIMFVKANTKIVIGNYILRKDLGTFVTIAKLLFFNISLLLNESKQRRLI